MTAPVYTVDDDSDEETREHEDKNAKISAQVKSGRSARKRNYIEYVSSYSTRYFSPT